MITETRSRLVEDTGELIDSKVISIE